MAKKIIWIALLACFLISPLSFAADVEVDLTTANGSTAFEVQDSGSNAVMSVASNGNTRIKGNWGILEGGAGPTRYSIFQGGDQAADITYTLPTADAAGVLTSNGSGVLSWAAGGGSVADDSLDFTKFEDTLDLDANLILNQTTNTWTQNFTGDTTNGLTYNAVSLTSGDALRLAVDTDTLTSGKAFRILGTADAATEVFSVDGAGNVNFGVAGVKLSNDGDGALTLLGMGNGSDEDLTINLDDTSNTAVLTSSTGLNNITLTGIDLTVPTEVYDATGWDSDLTVPTKDAVRDKIENLTVSGGSVSADSLDFAQLEDTLDLDAALVVNQTTNTWIQNFTGAATSGLTLNANSLTSGTGLAVASSATAFTGTLQDITLSGDNGANTGTLLKSTVSGTSSAALPLMVTNLGAGNSFRVNDETGDTDATPFIINAAGNVGVGDPSPASLFTVGAADLFQVDSSGDMVKIKNVTYAWPAANASGILTNNGTGTLSWASGSSTAWDAIGDATADGTIANGAFETDFTSTLDSAGKAFLTITNTDADTAADTDFISLVHNDGADANIFYLRAVGDADGTPQTDYLFSQTAATIRPDLSVTGAVTAGGLMTGNAGLKAANGATSAGFVDIFEDTDDGGNKTRFQVAPQAGDITYTLPATNVAAPLMNNGSGTLSWSNTGLPVEFIVAVSDETTALTTGTSKITFRMPYAMTLTEVRANVITAPTGATVVVDINETGASVISTKLSIDTSEKTTVTAAAPAVISDSALADDAEITIDIDQVGSTVAGVGLKVLFKGTRA